MRKNSVKNTRINGEVRRVLAEVIRSEIKDPRISPFTSVVSVEVAPDLKSCKAWISVLGGEEERAATLQGLKSAMGFIKMRLAKVVNLRNTPDITFVMDQSIEYGVHMSHRIDEVIAADDANRAEADAARAEEDADEAEADADGAEAEAGKAEMDVDEAEAEAGKAEMETDEAEAEAGKAEMDVDEAEAEAGKAEMDADEAEAEAGKAEMDVDGAEAEAR